MSNALNGSDQDQMTHFVKDGKHSLIECLLSDMMQIGTFLLLILLWSYISGEGHS